MRSRKVFGLSAAALCVAACGRDAATDYGRAYILHGHGQTPDVFARDNLGNELADRGFLVVIPMFEPFACGDAEAATSALLLEHGFTLIGISRPSSSTTHSAAGW
jgi:hypothetical protein